MQVLASIFGGSGGEIAESAGNTLSTWGKSIGGNINTGIREARKNERLAAERADELRRLELESKLRLQEAREMQALQDKELESFNKYKDILGNYRDIRAADVRRKNRERLGIKWDYKPDIGEEISYDDDDEEVPRKSRRKPKAKSKKKPVIYEEEYDEDEEPVEQVQLYSANDEDLPKDAGKKGGKLPVSSGPKRPVMRGRVSMR